MAPHRERDEKIEAWVTEEFKEEIRVAAAKRGVPMSELTRQALRNVIERTESGQSDKETTAADA